MAGLEAAVITEAILAAAKKLEEDGAWSLRTAVVMCDHVHLLVVLGEQAELAAAMRLLKGRTALVLRTVGLRWERGYFDHRLRLDEERLPVFRYVFLNPDRSDLLKLDEQWPGYFCAPEDWAWFKEQTNDESPFPEWLG